MTPLTLTVASYNIHGCRGWDRRTDPDRIARVISELDTDIVALQEVHSRLGQADDLRQLHYLAEATAFESIPGPALLRADAPCGTALLTRCPVLAVRHLDLSVDNREPRGALDVEVRAGGCRVRIISTHLGLRAWERRLQVERLLAALPPPNADAVILTGDINEWFPLGRPLRRLHNYFGRSPAPATFPSFFPLLALDRLWVKRHSGILDTTIATRITPLTRIASDHLPLLAKIHLQ